MQPSLAGFLNFVRTQMGITTAVLPDSSPVIAMALGVALAIANPWFACVGRTLWPGIVIPGVPQVSIYTLMVYNLAGSNLINYAQDVPDAPPVKGSELPYFENLRDKWDINGFVSGIIQESHDETTGNSMVVQEAAKNFTLADLQYLKDPYGRQYLAFAQRYGTLWGIN
jgi:hypothetical protein